MKKLVLISLSLVLSLLVMVAFYQKNQLARQADPQPEVSQMTEEPTSSQPSDSVTNEESSANSDSQGAPKTIQSLVGNWQLNIPGQEGYHLVIDEGVFQFYALYNGHVVPPNKKEVSYQFSADGQSITAVGVRDESDAFGGERIGNQLVRDTLVINIKADQKLTVVANGVDIALSDGQEFFEKTSEVPEITELPGS